MKRLILILSICLLLSLSVVFALFITTERKPNHKFNSFDRSFVDSDFIEPTDTLYLKYSFYYFAGISSENIYLSHAKIINHLLVADTKLNDTTHLVLEFDSLKNYRSVQVIVDSPYFYLTDGTIPFIYKGDISNKRASLYMDSIPFINAYPLSDNSIGLLLLSNFENTLAKVTKWDSKVSLFRELLEEQKEGIFSTSGVMHYDKNNGRLIYIYHYRNQFICMDTSFNLIYRSNTIDTLTHAQIEVSKITSSSSFSMSAPPLLVNSKSTISDDFLYVNSNILARNENAREFENQSVIDVYDLKNGSYCFSFYIPSFMGGKPVSFKVLRNMFLFALYDKYIVRYRIDDNVFKEINNGYY